MIEYLHTAKDPERRIVRLDLISYLRARETDTSLNATEVYSKETYAGILATRAARRPAFELRWETTTPGLAPPDVDDRVRRRQQDHPRPLRPAGGHRVSRAVPVHHSEEGAPSLSADALERVLV